MKTKEATEDNETVQTQVLGSREFNEERSLGFQVYRTKRPKENVGWLITTLFLFFSLLFSVSRFTIIGQFLDDTLFNLPWGWLKFPVYLIFFALLFAFYFNYHFKFKLTFILMSFGALFIVSWMMSLALLTYFYDRQIVLYETPINRLWDRNILAKSFQIYWLNWKELSVFGANYAQQTKMDFLFKNQGYVSLYAAGGVFGYFLASVSYYLTLPGAYIFYSVWATLIGTWLMTGDPLYCLKPKHKRYGRALRLLALKRQDKPKSANSPLISTKPSLEWAETDSDPYLTTELLTLQHLDDNFSLRNQSFSEDEFTLDEESLEEETLVPEAEDMATVIEANGPSVEISTAKKPKFASTILQTSLDQKVAPRFQSRRAPDGKTSATQLVVNNEIPLAKLQQKRTHQTPKPQATRQAQSEIYNQLDPQEARRLFERETSVTPFGKIAKDPIFQETRYPNYQLPTLALLDPETNQLLNRQHNQNYADQIVQRLNYWLISQQLAARCQLVALGEAVARYQFECDVTLDQKHLINQESELKLLTRALTWRWVVDKQNPQALIFEIPNPNLLKVQLQTVLQGIPQNKQNYSLLFGLGKRLSGELLTANLENMPHILIAGQAKTGKTGMLSNLLASLLIRNKPDQLKLVIIDSPNQDLINFSHLPHLLTPFISNGHHIYPVLQKLTKVINQRYHLFNALKVNNIETYNQQVTENEKLPYLVILINELAELKNNPDWNLINSRLKQLTEQGQNFGLHFVLATAEPQATLKDQALLRNCPTRLSFKLPNEPASQAILGHSGAEQLIAPGDFLFTYPGAPQLIRAQSVLLSEGELKRLLTFIYHQVTLTNSSAN